MMPCSFVTMKSIESIISNLSGSNCSMIGKLKEV